MVRAAARDFAAQTSSPSLTEEQRNEAAKLRQQAERATQAGRFGEALRNYPHATAVVRHARWTAAAELAASIELRVEHVVLEPGQPVWLSLARFASGAAVVGHEADGLGMACLDRHSGAAATRIDAGAGDRSCVDSLFRPGPNP